MRPAHVLKEVISDLVCHLLKAVALVFGTRVYSKKLH